ncbi:MAG TPA: zinc-dependent metalloprotease [Bryobacteraceae bacterium]|nr:zinc-dependent metalloprotease [Bryobacteraceae bacterium]
MFLILASVLIYGQEPAPPAETPAAATPPAAAPGPAPRNTGDPQPYDRVITKEAKSAKGIFAVHQVKDRYYYEIPKSELGKEFLLNVRIARTTVGVGYGGDEISDRIVRWELNGNKVNLRDVNYNVTAAPNTPIALAVKAANNDAILMTFAVAAFSKEGAPVIDVSRLYSTDVPEFGVRQHLNATNADGSRSYIERISPYPGNVEAESTLTYTRGQGGGAGAGAGGMRPGSASVVVHYSMVKLPENPMMPRLFDERVGYFSTSMMDYSREEQRAPRVRYIARWRLEKKDPAAAVSDPVKPIVYYIDAATPVKWREWLKKGIEDWQPAFEAAGFSHAIVAKIAPTHDQDPDFSPEDVRNSVVRWMPSTTENALGPHISDPRTGEILNADIIFYHNIMNLQRDWYFLQAGPLDPRARKLPLPDDLMGRLLEFVVAHEVGHTLGLQHNMKASSMYPQEKVRDKEWVHKMGHAPSIMDYSRFNYVAQPEDGIAVEDLVPRIGPYDVFALKWGYTPITAKSPDDEKVKLNEWARAQDTTPWLRFSTAGAAGSDFGELTEAVGDADAVKSSALGLKNLQRVAKMLMPATTAKSGEPYEDLAELYGRMLGQWTLEMNHVAAVVGSFDSQTKYAGQEGRLFTPVAKARQQAAMSFLADNAFATPRWAIDPEILRRIEPIGVLGRIRNAQNTVLTNLLSSARFARLVEQQAVDGPSAYAPEDFLAATRRAIWRELDSGNVKIDAYRRNLQHAWLDLSNTKVNSNPPVIPANAPPELAAQLAVSADEKPFYRAELRRLSAKISAALERTADRETRAHLQGARDQIARILDPKFNPGGNGAAAPLRIAFDGFEVDGAAQPDICWRDYVILPN